LPRFAWSSAFCPGAVDRVERLLVDEQGQVELPLVDVDEAEVVVGVDVVRVLAERLLRFRDREIVLVLSPQHADHADDEVRVVRVVLETRAVVLERLREIALTLRDRTEVEPRLTERRVEGRRLRVGVLRLLEVAELLVRDALVVEHLGALLIHRLESREPVLHLREIRRVDERRRLREARSLDRFGLGRLRRLRRGRFFRRSLRRGGGGFLRPARDERQEDQSAHHGCAPVAAGFARTSIAFADGTMLLSPSARTSSFSFAYSVG
jgi:hypothetical protein